MQTAKKQITALFAILLLTVYTIPVLKAQKDSVIRVKGQVSDYFIPVTQSRTVTGRVVDHQNQPVEGATIMPHKSPAHTFSNAEGSFSLLVHSHEKELMIYAPGFNVSILRVDPLQNALSVQLQPGRNGAQHTVPSKATPWFDPHNDRPTTYCNPTNISYNFEPMNNNVRQYGSFRSAADPILVLYKDEYYLFSTNQGGFHWSKDMATWNYVHASFQRTPTDDDQCAPAAFVRGDTLFYTGSTYEGLPIWYSTDPKSGRFRRYVEKTFLPSWDPGFFENSDGRLYLYYGSSNEYPLKGVELDPQTFEPISRITDIMRLRPDLHGWERFGMNNDDSTTLAPFTEGGWINKHNGKYYFQYGAPGTEFKVYADGVYVADSPLGPFTYQKHNPMSYKPGGFVQGAGHGGTFQDKFDNFWHVATCMLSNKYKFERRVGIYPSGVDSDGVMYSITSFGDYPTFTPKAKEDHTQGKFAGWMLLSYHKPVKASSVDSTCTPNRAVDENMRTFWSAASADRGEWFEVDLGSESTVRAIQVNFYEHKAVQHNRAMDIYHQYRIYSSTDRTNWELVVDKGDNDRDVPHDYVELRQPLQTRYLKIVNEHTAAGNFALSGFRIFGNTPGKLPDAVRNLTVDRPKADEREATIRWQPVEGAYGYNVYYGTAPNKLYHCITVYGETSYYTRGLDKGTAYYFAIEALSQTGRSPKTKPIKVTSK